MGELGELPLPRLYNFLYWYLTRNADQEGLNKFNARLWMPPKGEEPDARSPWSAENELKAAMAFQVQVGLTPDGAKGEPVQ